MALKCCRLCQGFLRNANRISGLNLQPSRTAFWKRGKDEAKEEEQERMRSYRPGMDGPLIKETLNPLKQKVSLDTKKAYTPPEDVMGRVEKVVIDVCGKQDDLENTPLTDPEVKFKVLSRLIEDLDHDMPASVLTEVKSVQQVIDYFSTEVRQTICIEDMKAQPDLPKNLHIRTEYMRFDPNTDTMFEGRTAFPGQNTYVTSIKYKRKYAQTETEKPKPGYYNRYYGY